MNQTEYQIPTPWELSLAMFLQFAQVATQEQKEYYATISQPFALMPTTDKIQ
jgi:hypothetical protein